MRELPPRPTPPSRSTRPRRSTSSSGSPRSSRPSGASSTQQGRARRPDGPPAREGPPPRGRGARDRPRGRQGPDRGRGRSSRPRRTASPTPSSAPASRPSTASANDIDRVLVESRDLDERRAVWEASKAIGGPLRDGLLQAPRPPQQGRPVRRVRRRSSRLQVADYGMTVPEMLGPATASSPTSSRSTSSSTPGPSTPWPKRYKADVARRPDPRPLAPEPLGPELARPGRGHRHGRPVQGQDRRSTSPSRPSSSTSRSASRGCPKSFYEKSDLYPADPKSGRKKNSHASAWHIDLRDDVRSLMSIEPDMQLVHHGAPRTRAYLLLHQLLDARGPRTCSARGPTGPSTRRSAT